VTVFYDYTTTFSNDTQEVTCCTLWQSPTTATCGRGLSCGAVCRAQDSTLCASGDCQNCENIEESRSYKNQITKASNNQESKNNLVSKKLSHQRNTKASNITRRACLSWGSDSSCNRCVGDNCRIKRSPGCCFHPLCRKKRKRKCSWLQNYLGTSCPKPVKHVNGSWTCEVQEVPIPTTAELSGGLVTKIDTYKVLQCRLRCSPGYASDLPPIVSCVNGMYQPYRPEEFRCEKMVALTISTDGQMEIFSDKCSKLLPNIPAMALTGHTVNLADQQLIIGAEDTDSKGWWYWSLEEPRSGILSNRWTRTKTLSAHSPRNHISFNHDKDVIYVGGTQKVGSKLQNGRIAQMEWNNFVLEEDGESFDKFVSDGCVVQLTHDIFYVLGGTDIIKNEATSRVIIINMKEQKVQERGSLVIARTQHGCALLSEAQEVTSEEAEETSYKFSILISGGLRSAQGSNIEIAEDEVFDVTAGTSEVLTQSMNTPRYNHRLIKLGEVIYSLGGQTSDGSATSSVEMREATSGLWSFHQKGLLSTSTAGLAVTGLPASAVDCQPGCSCGKVDNSRIIGGSQAQASSHPWLGLLLVRSIKYREDDLRYSKCSATLIGTQCVNRER